MRNKVVQPLIIKKYENRRLYNTLTSQYINQEQVAQLVRDGHDVRVIDSATGDDVTRLVLAQIVLEDAKTPDSVFPLDVLRQMVVASGKATQESALRYMKAMMEIYQNAYRAMPSPLNPFEFIATPWAQPQARTGSPGSAKHAGDVGRPRAVAADASGGAGGEVDELRRRIEELEAALSHRSSVRQPRRSKVRRKA